jgi:hypothetical protein
MYKEKSGNPAVSQMHHDAKHYDSHLIPLQQISSHVERFDRRVGLEVQVLRQSEVLQKKRQMTWDRCCDFLNICAKKLAFLTQNKAKL